MLSHFRVKVKLELTKDASPACPTPRFIVYTPGSQDLIPVSLGLMILDGRPRQLGGTAVLVLFVVTNQDEFELLGL